MYRKIQIFIVVLFLIFAKVIFAQSSTIKINEFLIEPTPQIVELLNTGTEIVDLSNWYIDDNGGTTYFTIPTGTQLYPNACISFSGSLNLNKTTVDSVRLFDSTAPPTTSSANLIDSFEYKSSSGSGITFQRIPDGQNVWATGTANFDLYNLTGISCKVEPTPTSLPSPTASTGEAELSITPSQTPTPTAITPPIPTPIAEIKAIYLSEVYPYPNESETEWVEIFNDNAFSVFLDNWKLDDVEDAGSSPKKFSITIPSYSFETIDLSSSIFNNDGDDVRLLNANDTLVDSFSYDDVEKGKSVGRISFSSTTYCVQNSSKEYSNDSCINESTPTPTVAITPTPTNSQSAKNISSSVLGASTDNSTYDSYEPVRPTQYYERPIIEEEDKLEEDSKNNKDQEENKLEEHKVSVIKSATLISALSSFLTAGFLFIRIML